jgi:hypothetical protein
MRAVLLSLCLVACTEAQSEIPTPAVPALVRDVVSSFETNRYSKTGQTEAEVTCKNNEQVTGGGCRCVPQNGAIEDPHLIACLPTLEGYQAKCTPDAAAVEVHVICHYTKVINVVARRFGDPFTYSVDGPKPVTGAVE